MSRQGSDSEREAIMKIWMIENWLSKSIPYFPVAREGGFPATVNESPLEEHFSEILSSQASNSTVLGPLTAEPDLPISSEVASTSSVPHNTSTFQETVNGPRMTSPFPGTSGIANILAMPGTSKAVPTLPICSEDRSVATMHAFSPENEPFEGTSKVPLSASSSLVGRDLLTFSSVSEISPIACTSAMPGTSKAAPIETDSSTDTSSTVSQKMDPILNHDLPESFYRELFRKVKKLYHHLFRQNQNYSSFNEQDYEYSDSTSLEGQDKMGH